MGDRLRLTTTVKGGNLMVMRMHNTLSGDAPSKVTGHFVRCTRELEEKFGILFERVWQGGVIKTLLARNMPRPEALLFAQLMERELRENDGKGGWGACAPQQLLRMVWGDVNKLDSALERGDLAKVQEQAADVANGCMMLLDVLGLLLPPAAESPASAPAPAEAKGDANG